MNPGCNDSNAMVHQLQLYLIVLILLSRANILPHNICKQKERKRDAGCMQIGQISSGGQ